MSDPIAAVLTRAIGVRVHDNASIPVGGGSIHEARRYRTDDGSVFVKLAPLASSPMFAAEADGLHALAATRTVRTPAVLAIGAEADTAFLCLEWLEFAAGNRASEASLGAQLAALHRCCGDTHGWTQDNFIGRTPQRNTRTTDWPVFFREQRLLPQFELAAQQGADTRTLDAGYRLAASLEQFFASYRPSPSLLHGDLWGGNWGVTRDGTPALFDPAVYYGDREADLAMTFLFGGFSADFYAAYEDAWPLDKDATTRRTLYNLYHVLNHFNLFGGGYLAQARSMINELLALTRA